ncbi:MAG: GGDEF domain-containing protein [Pseudobdellovibrionaceae bacterium]
MNLKELRSQFTVFIFFPDADENTAIKGAFVEAGYESFIFIDQDLLLQRLKEAAPHVVLFSVEALDSSLSDFVSQVLEANSEVQFACVAPAAQSDTLNEYREYNFASMIPSGEQVPVRSVWAVDQVCETLYRTYQNEELLKKSEDVRFQASQLQKRIHDLESRKPIVREVPFVDKMAIYQNANSKDDYLEIFLKSLPCKGIYFKFLATVSSFVATSAQGIDIESIKGVGSRLTPEETKNLLDSLSAGEVPRALQELMNEGLKVRQYFSKPVPVHQALDGLFIFWGNLDFHFQQIENDFLVFQLLYQQAHLIKRSEALDIFDSVTELYNRNYFLKKIEEEIARSRRLEKAVSVIRLSIDHLAEMEQSFGRSNRDLILRTIASIVKKTSRVNDMACRTEDNEFSLILPHCARKGAALRAERLRRIIEGHTFAINDLKVTISCGVSEYPSLSTGASDLEVSASKALEFIASRGGNKVCLFKPVHEFKPDFVVPPM